MKRFTKHKGFAPRVRRQPAVKQTIKTKRQGWHQSKTNRLNNQPMSFYLDSKGRVYYER